MHKLLIACVFATLFAGSGAQADAGDDALRVLRCFGTLGLRAECKFETSGTGANFPEGPVHLECGPPQLKSTEVIGSPRKYTTQILCGRRDAAGSLSGATGFVIAGTWNGQTAVESVDAVSRQATCDGDPWIENGQCGQASVSGAAAGATSEPFPATAAMIPEAMKKMLRVQANTPRIEAPQNSQKQIANLPLIIKINPNPAAPSQFINLQIVDMAGKVQAARFMPLLAPKGFTWPHKLTGGFAGLKAQWDYQGAPWSTPITLAVQDALSFPPPGAASYKTADSYLTSNGCKHFLGRPHEYVCTPQASYQTCLTYQSNPVLEVKKCYKGG